MNDRLLTEEEITKVNKNVYGDIEILTKPQPEDLAICKSQDLKTASIKDKEYEAKIKELELRLVECVTPDEARSAIKQLESDLSALKAEKKSILEELRTLLKRDYNMADAYYIKIDVFEAFKSKYLEE
jgi:hypothetical protein